MEVDKLTATPPHHLCVCSAPPRHLRADLTPSPSTTPPCRSHADASLASSLTSVVGEGSRGAAEPCLTEPREEVSADTK